MIDPRITYSPVLIVVGMVILMFLPSSAFAQVGQAQMTRWHVGVFAGKMTPNDAAELVNASELNFANNELIGLTFGFEQSIRSSRWSLGAEIQLNRHFGKQEYVEFVLPITLRYRPIHPWLPAIESFAFGLGGSHTTKIPQVEIDTHGASRRNLIYWFLETEIGIGDFGNSLFFRIHHRSDAFGLLEPNAGSNALVAGFRRSF